MKIFIDTANLDEIKEAFSWGIVDGVTTHPSLIKKAVDSCKGKINLENYIKDILKVSKNTPVSLEVIGTTYDEMYEQGMKLYDKFHTFGKIAVKVPVCTSLDGETNIYDGLKAIKRMSEKKVPVNATLIMTPEQALLAAKAGATYVSPFAGRIDDYLRKNVKNWEKTDYFPATGNGEDDNGIISGVDLVSETVDILEKYEMPTEIIAASVRNTRQVRELALKGAHIATIPFNVLEKMLIHEKTQEGMKSFIKDTVPEYEIQFR